MSEILLDYNIFFFLCSSVRLLGVTVTPDLQLDKYVTSVSATCFYQLRQLRRIRHSLDRDSVATLVHAFVTSRVDYCLCLLAGASLASVNKLQRVMNAAARIVTDTQKFDRGLSHLMHEELHWLDVRERIQFRLAVTMYKCLHGMAPRYLSELCVPVSTLPSHRRLRSACTQQLVVPGYRLSSFGPRSFAVAGPSLWNSLPKFLTLLPTLDSFKRHLKTFLFAQY